MRSSNSSNAERSTEQIRKLRARLDSQRWVVLTDRGNYTWNVQLWGPEALNIDVLGLTAAEAKAHGLALVGIHLSTKRPGVRVPDDVRWRPVGSGRTRPNAKMSL